MCVITVLAESYEKSFERGDCTSASNFFKTDKKYIDNILADFAISYNRYQAGRELKNSGKIFMRK